MGTSPPALEATFPLGRWAGIALRIHASALLALPFFAWFAETRMRVPVALATLEGRWPLAGSRAWSALLTLGVVFALVLHQAAHAAVGRLCGGQVRGVTFVLVGGCTPVEGLRGRARVAMVAAAGPVANMVGGLACTLAAFHLTEGHVDARFALTLLGQVQLALGVLELLPALPLDGGRLLLSALEPRLGRVRALEQVARFARLLGAAIAIYGAFSTSALAIAVAAVVWAGAETTSSGLLGDERLRRVTVRAALGPLPWPLAWIDAGATVEQLATLMRFQRVPRVVVAESGAPIALVTADDVAHIPEQKRAHTCVRALGRATPTVDANSSLGHARSLLRASRQRALPVTEEGVLVALLSDEAIVVAAELHTLGR